MPSPSGWVTYIIENLKEYATAASFFLAIGGAVASVGAKTLSAWFSLNRKSGVAIKVPGDTVNIGTGSEEAEAIVRESLRGGPSSSTATVHKSIKTRDAALPILITRGLVVVRINEAVKARAEQLGTAKWSKVSSNSLIIAQYIIGGVLATSFVQESLKPKWIGAMGVVVLIASLFRQQFHPEINAQEAQAKASKLKALIRASEDQLAILDAKIASGQDHSDAMIALLTTIRERLTEIEDPEAVDSKPSLVSK